MKILFIGDIFGAIGRRVLAENLSEIKNEFSIDLTIANGENCAGGRGLTGNILEKLHKYGVDIVTGGNHSLRDDEVYKSNKYYKTLLRPLNIPLNAPGNGKLIHEMPNGKKIGILNLHGRTFVKMKLDCPFVAGMNAVDELRKITPLIFVDFHAEATSEKICLAHYLDGKVGAFTGTHTHVQTSDERILKGGTAFITDAGMTGPEDSAIGMKQEAIIRKYINNSHERFEPSKKGPMLNAVVFELDDDTGKAISVERIYRRYIFDD